MAEIREEHRRGEERFRDDRGWDRPRRRRRNRGARALADSAVDMTRETTRFVRAWTEASTEVWLGMTEVFGNLVGDLTDSVVGGQRRRYADDDYDDEDYEDEEEERDREERGRSEVRAEHEGGRRYRGSVRADRDREEARRDFRRDVRGRTRDIRYSMSDAIRETARVMQRSADRFARIYDDSQRRREEGTTSRDQTVREPDRDRERGDEGAPQILNERGEAVGSTSAQPNKA